MTLRDKALTMFGGDQNQSSPRFSMGPNDKIIVYIACQHCELVYRTTQVQVPMAVVGHFDCAGCGQQVYSWKGRYDYFRWKPVTHRKG